MDFEKWYDDNLREEDFRMQMIVMKGKTFNDKDCEEFWTAYKASLKRAYEEGQKNPL